MNPQETVPCQFCGTPTEMTGTRKCDRCWEVSKRLADFVKTEAGRKFAQTTINEAAREAKKS